MIIHRNCVSFTFWHHRVLLLHFISVYHLTCRCFPFPSPPLPLLLPDPPLISMHGATSDKSIALSLYFYTYVYLSAPTLPPVLHPFPRPSSLSLVPCPLSIHHRRRFMPGRTRSLPFKLLPLPSPSSPSPSPSLLIRLSCSLCDIPATM